MINGTFRPWGGAEWLLTRLPAHEWSVIGAVSSEDRCNAILHHMRQPIHLKRASFLEIADVQSHMSGDIARRVDLTRREFVRLSGANSDIQRFGLLDPYVTIKSYIQSLISDGCEHVIVDISSLPKKFFFPIVRLLMEDVRVLSVLAAYSIPDKYFEGDLSFEIQDWAFIPPFQREVAPPVPACNRVIVGVGFMPFRLPELLKNEYQDSEVSLILPFPPGPPQFQRNWRFVHEIEKTSPLSMNDSIIRVDARDLSGCFDFLNRLVPDEQSRALFAPYGPKPHSLAMSLFAANHSCDVFYTQPKHYHPEYSTGMRMVNGLPLTYVYSLKSDGVSLYQ